MPARRYVPTPRKREVRGTNEPVPRVRLVHTICFDAPASSDVDADIGTSKAGTDAKVVPEAHEAPQ